MNHTYTKRPIDIQAFQMTRERRDDNKDWPDWLNQAWNKNPLEEGAVYINTIDRNKLIIRTLEGNHNVLMGDFIIQGVDGELYPCKASIFEKTYIKKQ